MARKDNDFLKKLQATFAIEADEHLKAMSDGLLALEKSPVAGKWQEIVENIYRETHSLKGAARAVNRNDVEAVCQPLESVFAAVKRGVTTLSPELFDLFHKTVNGLERLLTSPASDVSQVAPLVQRLEEALTGLGDRVLEIRDRGSAVRDQAVSTTPVARPLTPETVRVAISKLDALFRQAEEMIAAKLAAEQRVADIRELGTALGMMKRASESMRSHLPGVLPLLEEEMRKGGTRRGTEDITGWLEALDEEDTATRSLANKIAILTAAAEADRRALGKMIDNLLEDAKKLLMLPLSSLFEILPKIVRDLAREQGKDVELVIQGSDIEIDRRIQEEMKDPLIHLLRNCVDHGIEAPAERTRKKKPARGKIAVSVSQKEAGKAEIVIADDGAGIDCAKVLAAAQNLGMVPYEAAKKLNEQDAATLVFRSGVSTSSVVTDISGRGLGLAIVMEKIEKLGGTIALETQSGAGTTFRIMLPVTLAALRGVVVRACEQLFVLPTVNVERVVRVRKEDVKTVENRETLLINGHTLSLVHLAEVLGLGGGQEAADAAEYRQVIVLVSGGERIAYVVDEVLNEQEVLLKGLGSQLARVRNIAGATALGTGKLAPFLNVSDLMRSSVDHAAPVTEKIAPAAAEAQKKSVLVVEDSITARALLKNILEATGFRVKTAVDGLDALTTLKTESFDLVVSDVEMPRMDGFDLTMKIRADRKLAELPVVLVTALDSRENRERGIDAGANAYIVKSSFDQTNLLEVIKRLV